MTGQISDSQDTVFCPNCQSENPSRVPSRNEPPSFCLQCRFPLMLVANKYRLIRVLGRGGFGTVYEARHIHLTREEERVVKVLHPELLEDEGVRRRFLREIQVTCLLSQRNHHIVRIYDDFGQMSDLGFYYVMEFLQGHPLNRLMQLAKPLMPLPLVYHLFDQLCVAMEAAHREGVIHRDLKPANLYVVQHLEDPSFLKVLDFGVAKALQASADTARLTKGVIGTPAYMAPEQCANEDVGPGADIYAMAVILFELLVGSLPFVSPDSSSLSAAELLTAHLTRTPPRLHDVLPPERDVPEALSDVLAKALTKYPEERFASARSFQEAFREAIGQQPGSTETRAELMAMAHQATRSLLPFALQPTGEAQAVGRDTMPSAMPLALRDEHTGDLIGGGLPSAEITPIQLHTEDRVQAGTDPELRRMKTPYASLPGVAPRGIPTGNELRDTAVGAAPPSSTPWLLVSVCAVLIFALSGVLIWLLKNPQTPPATSKQPAAQVTPSQRPLGRVLERPAATKKAPERRAAAVRRAPTRRKARVVRTSGRRPRRRWRRPTRPRRRWRRSKPRNRRRARPLARPVARPPAPRPVTGVAGCPAWKGHQVYVRFRRVRPGDVSAKLRGSGRIIAHKGGLCVGVKGRSARLDLSGRGFRVLTPCRFRVWGRATRLTLRMHEKRSDSLEPDSIDYCLQ